MSKDIINRLDSLVEALIEGDACNSHDYISAAIDAMECVEELMAERDKLQRELRRLGVEKLND